MSNLNSLKELLESGIITKDEYDVITERLQKSDINYEKTWEDILKGFYSWCTNKYSVTTAKGYKTCLYKFITHLTKESNKDLALQRKFKPYTFANVNGFLNNMQDDGFSSQTISKIKYAIIVLGVYLSDQDIKTPDVSKIKISINKDVNNTTIALSHEEVLEIANIGDLRSKVCIMLGYEGVLKRIELANLKVTDFNFGKHQLFVRDNQDNIDRICILSEDTTNTVKNYIDELYYNIENWNKNRVAKGKEPREDFGYIFQNVKITVPSYAVLHNSLKENAKNYYIKKGVPEEQLSKMVSQITFETIRNSRRVYLLSKGVNINEVMQICGDKNYMSTYRFMKLVPLLYPESVNNNMK